MEKGYEFIKVHNLENAHDIISATYVLTMTKSTRCYMSQLNRFSPSIVNYIVKNDGYKNVKRILCKYKPVYDVVYSYATIFEHASVHHPGQPILLLEDDFFWKKDVSAFPSIFKDILSFIQDNKEIDHYWLGCIPLPYLTVPIRKGNHIKLNGRTLASHAVISTSKGMKSFVHTARTSPCTIEFPDPFMSENHICYRYISQLCYQLFEDSPSQHDSWPKYLPSIVKLLKLDKEPEPFWTFSYNLNRFSLHTLVIIIIIISLSAWQFASVPKRIFARRQSHR